MSYTHDVSPLILSKVTQETSYETLFLRDKTNYSMTLLCCSILFYSSMNIYGCLLITFDNDCLITN